MLKNLTKATFIALFLLNIVHPLTAMERDKKASLATKYQPKSLLDLTAQATIALYLNKTTEEIQELYQTKLPSELVEYIIRKFINNPYPKNPYLLHYAESSFKIEQLLAFGSNPNLQRIDNGETPLHTMMSHGKEHLGKFLKNKTNLDLSLCDYHGMSVLQKEELLKTLQPKSTIRSSLSRLFYSKQPTTLDQQKAAALIDFYLESDDKISKVSSLKNKFKELAINLEDFINSPITKHGWTQLHKANTPEKVKKLIKLGADPHCLSHELETPLHTLIKQRFFDAALSLLTYKIDCIDLHNCYGETPLCLAAQSGCFELIKLLAKYDANFFHIRNYNHKVINPFVSAVQADEYLIAKYIRKKLAPTINTKVFFHALMASAQNNNYEMYKMITGKSKNISKLTDEDNKTLLMWAISHNFETVFKKLLKWGINPLFVNSRNETALLFAAQNERPEICQLLLENGALLTQQNLLGQTPLMISLSKGNDQCVELMLRYIFENALDQNGKLDSDKIKKYFELKDINGDTALHHALTNLEYVKKLLSMGADVRIVNNKGQTPLLSAVAQGISFATIEYLFQANSNPYARDNQNKNIFDYTRNISEVSMLEQYIVKYSFIRKK